MKLVVHKIEQEVLFLVSREQKGMLNWKDSLKALTVVALASLAVLWVIRTAIGLVGGWLAPLLEVVSEQDTTVIVALVTGGVSIITVVLGTIVNSWLTYSTRCSEYLREHRETPYRQLVKIFYDFQMRVNTGNPVTQEELLTAMNAFNQELTLWGSSKAIREWGNWRVSSGRGKLSGNELLFGMEGVIRQLRRDLGQKRGLRKGDILRLFVNDIDDYL